MEYHNICLCWFSPNLGNCPAGGLYSVLQEEDKAFIEEVGLVFKV